MHFSRLAKESRCYGGRSLEWMRRIWSLWRRQGLFLTPRGSVATRSTRDCTWFPCSPRLSARADRESARVQEIMSARCLLKRDQIQALMQSNRNMIETVLSAVCNFCTESTFFYGTWRWSWAARNIHTRRTHSPTLERCFLVHTRPEEKTLPAELSLYTILRSGTTTSDEGSLSRTKILKKRLKELSLSQSSDIVCSLLVFRLQKKAFLF